MSRFMISTPPYIWHFTFRAKHRIRQKYSTVQYSTVQYSTVQYSSVQFSSVQFSTVQYSSVQFSSVQFSSVQFSFKTQAATEHTPTNRPLHVLCCTYTAVYCKPHFDEITTVLLHPGDDKKIIRLFYATAHCLTMDRWGPKHVAVDVLKHYCDYNEVCAFVGNIATILPKYY